METVKKKAALTALGAVLVTIIFFCFSQSVYSQGKRAAALSERESTKEAEAEYVRRVAELLEEYGCEHSGITMTKTFSEGCDVSYRVIIHHRNLSFLTKGQMQELEKRLTEVSEPVEGAGVAYSFSCLS